jgi:polysaccharide deacetylase 2 family uncharacterized protein YibQ
MAKPLRRKGPPPRRQRGFPAWGWALLVLGVFAAGLWLGRSGWLDRLMRPARPQLGGAVADATPAPAEGERPRRPGNRPPAGADTAPTPQPLERPAGHIALVIDDLGRSLEDLDALAALGVPISYAVLPYEELTAQVVARLRAEDREILCHLPMEPGSERDPGPGALHVGMDEAALATATRQAVSRVPGAVGVNNHMGSSLTADQGAMGAVLQVLRQDGLFFLDSRTSAESVGYRLAQSLGLPSAERDVFLDPDPAPAAIREQFRRLLERARSEGAAIAIAHPLPGTLAVLGEEVPKAREAGYTFVPVSFLLDRTGDPL